MATDPREARRAAMPESSRLWDEFTEAFGTLAYYRAEENGRVIEWPKPRREQ